MTTSTQPSATLMIQGTTSDAGKSTLVAALCRIFARRGHSVTPFKPQNMALNGAVTCDGGEIGRAQAVQAQACYLQPHSDMNPVLLKPASDTDAQVIIHGKVYSHMNASGFHDFKRVAMDAVLASHQRLSQQYQIILTEGAGSPAEVNLRKNDIANMGFAEAVDCPVILIADIDRGGVFAHLIGTLAVLSESEKQRIKGFVINRFRGDINLLKPGLDWLESQTGKPVFGVIPYLQGFHIEAEDALTPSSPAKKGYTDTIKVIVPVLPRISNHTDFDSLRLHPQVDFQFIGPDQLIPPADLIIIPGSKNTRADLAWLKQQGWPKKINKHLRYGGKVIGICGGFQMLGKTINDANGIEGLPGCSDGLDLLPVETDLLPEKQLRQVSGLLFDKKTPFTGYEIHAGVSLIKEQQAATYINAHSETAEHITGDGFTFKNEGCLSTDHQVLGTYIHGLFDHPEACRTLLDWAGLDHQVSAHDYPAIREAAINRLADEVEKSLNVSALASWLHLPTDTFY